MDITEQLSNERSDPYLYVVTSIHLAE